jgi:hypothetical protein
MCVGSSGNKCVSVRDYYSYRLQMRPSIFNPIIYGKRLFQQFAVDTYVKIESSCLDFIRNNQDTVRVTCTRVWLTAIVQGWKKRMRLGSILCYHRCSSVAPVIWGAGIWARWPWCGCMANRTSFSPWRAIRIEMRLKMSYIHDSARMTVQISCLKCSKPSWRSWGDVCCTRTYLGR